MTGVEATDLIWSLADEMDKLSYGQKEQYRFHFRMVGKSTTVESARYWLPGAWAPVTVPAGLLEKGIKAVKASGWRVTRRYMPHGKLGQAKSKWRVSDGEYTMRSLCLNTCTDPGIMLLVLFHEWAHTILHHNRKRDMRGASLSKSIAEIEAETTCYLVARTLGIVSNTSALYLASSRGQTGSDLRVMPAQHYVRINRAANEILSALGY